MYHPSGTALGMGLLRSPLRKSICLNPVNFIDYIPINVSGVAERLST